MSAITSLGLAGVHCFEGTERVCLPRIAVLSAGKSTFPGCPHGIARLADRSDLNDENLLRSAAVQHGTLRDGRS